MRKLDLAGISFRPSRSASTRRAPLAAPVLGFVGTDNNGLGGLEYHYERAAHRARPASVQVERDPQGHEIPGGERR